MSVYLAKHITRCIRLLDFYSLKMIIRQGRFVEYSVLGNETSVDWTIISDAKGTQMVSHSLAHHQHVICTVGKIWHLLLLVWSSAKSSYTAKLIY